MWKNYLKATEGLGDLDTQENKEEYRLKIIEKMDKQTEKGIRKYHAPLSAYTDMDIVTRLEHLEEELIDGLFYIEHLLKWVKSK